jgi:hypothetical protein
MDTYTKQANLLALPALMDLALAGVDRGDSSPSTVKQRISSLFASNKIETKEKVLDGDRGSVSGLDADLND